jgi:hypothetical protein
VPQALTRRLLPLQIGVGLQGLMLWTPIEKLFQTEIGFDAASIGLMAAAYSAVVPLLEVPSGILADRWRRTGLLIIGGIAAAASALVGGLSHGVVTYIVAAMILGLYFAASSGTVDSVVYDTVIEETGSADLYEKVVGRVRIVESAAFAGSALVGGLLAGWTSPRLTYLVTVPFALLSVVALARFREPQLHRQGEPVALRRHIATTFGAMTRIPQVRHMLLLAALTALLSQAVFEFGPLWLVELDAPPAAYGPYWALLVATLGVGGYLAGRLHLDRTLPVLVLAGLLVVMPVVLATARILPVVAVAQTVLALVLATVGIHAGRLLHDAVPSAIRAGVSAGAGTFSWVLFLPFSLVFGALARDRGLAWSAWVLAGVAAVLAVLLGLSVRTARAVPVEVEIDEAARPGPAAAVPADLACRELVGIVTDYVDGVLPADWRTRADEHLRGCDGCTAYLAQIRDTVDLLARLDLPARPDGR